MPEDTFMEKNDFVFILAGYLFGSVLFARVFGRLFGHQDITENSRDGNPGTANAFMQGGFWCGTLTLLGDMAKGYLPVALYLRYSVEKPEGIAFALVLAAPVVGHIFPLFFKLKGGKGIATSFGCLLGLWPYYPPALILALSFLFFSVILRISPHYQRTIWTYLCAMVLMLFCNIDTCIILGFAIIVATILIRLSRSTEERERMQVKALWMR